MVNAYKSNSDEQQYAEHIIFNEVKSILNIDLIENPKIYLLNNKYTYINPDFYSEEYCVVGEIFAHIGKPKTGQDRKIASDILKMLLLDKVKGKVYRKIIVVCDENEEKKLSGLSTLAESIRRFEVEVMRVDISQELREQIVNAQKRQSMTNQ
ncbi:MAG: hypothetical protein IJ435_09940 [Clostridia bacterium]|nr:hypothetical protein [Clostridia bacterium]